MAQIDKKIRKEVEPFPDADPERPNLLAQHEPYC